MATFHILDGKRVAEAIRRDVGVGVTQLTAGGARPPGLTVLLVGEDPASAVYVGSKARSCEEVGMVSQVRRLPATTTEAELTQQLDELNADPTVDGILVQLPLPRHLPTRALLDRVDPSKDVDGFHPINVGRLWQGLPSFVPCTPAGVIEMLDREGIAVAGKHAVVVGRSDIVGKPMAALLLQRDCTVTVCHSRTPDLAATCRGAEILVAAVGRPFLIGPDHVAPGAVVIDVGMNRVSDPTLVERHIQDPKRRASFAANGSLLVGDVDFEAVASRTTAITPVPGGVGPLTVAMLLVNTLRARTERGS